jgi:hypothetical protein
MLKSTRKLFVVSCAVAAASCWTIAPSAAEPEKPPSAKPSASTTTTRTKSPAATESKSARKTAKSQPKAAPTQAQLKEQAVENLAKADASLGAALILYRDGKAKQADQTLVQELKRTKSNCVRQRIVGYLAMIRFAEGDRDKSAEGLFQQAVSDESCPIHPYIFLEYAKLLRAKGATDKANAMEKAAASRDTIGTCTMSQDGTLTLSLVSLPPPPIAHAVDEYPPSHKEYAETLGHIGPLKPKGSRTILPYY